MLKGKNGFALSHHQLLLYSIVEYAPTSTRYFNAAVDSANVFRGVLGKQLDTIPANQALCMKVRQVVSWLLKFTTDFLCRQ